MTVEQTVQFISNVGMPSFLILIGLYGLYQLAWYFLTEIAKPVAVRIVAFINELGGHVETLVGTTDRMCDQIERQGHQLNKHEERHDTHDRDLADIKQYFKK